MPKLVLGLPRREVARRLRQSGCTFEYTTSNGRELWKTPRGVVISLPAGTRKEISSADAMLMNQTLREEGLEEIRAPHNQKKKMKPEEQPTPVPSAPEPTALYRKDPLPLREIFYARLKAARQRCRKAS